MIFYWYKERQNSPVYDFYIILSIYEFNYIELQDLFIQYMQYSFIYSFVHNFRYEKMYFIKEFHMEIYLFMFEICNNIVHQLIISVLIETFDLLLYNN